MNFSFRQLRAFLAVAETASFTKAAAQLHVTQAGLSAMIRELEQSLDCRLFERSTRSVSLTAAGRDLLPTVRKTVADLSGAIQDVSARNAGQEQVLRLGVTPLIASSILPQVLQAFALRHPDWRAEVADLDRGLIEQGVENGTLDAGFGAFFQKSAGIRRRQLFPAELMLAQPPDAPRRKTALAWNRIDPEKLISLPAGNAIQQRVDRLLPPAPRRRGTYSHLETVLAMVEAGLGEAVVPSFSAVAGRRWRVRLQALAPRVAVDYFVISRSGRPLNAALEGFSQCLRQAAQGVPPS